jgi:DNA/RNA-binding domain of Phe-tRNA-synthetase-like protein
MIRVTNAWKDAYPNAHVGTLVMQNVENPRRHDELQRRKAALERELRDRFADHSRAELAALPVMRAYRDYYKRFRKTYHVLLQLRSVALEGRSLPTVAALVEAMFMAEIKNGLLTAGHDLEHVREPIALDVAVGDEVYITLNGKKQTLKPGDTKMTDAEGVICTVIYGLDRRTAVRPSTRRVMFVVYAPKGISPTAVQQHLTDIEENVRLLAPAAVTEALRIYPSEPILQQE